MFIIQGIRIQNRCKMKHFLVGYIGHYDISSQQIRQTQAYHRKTYCDLPFKAEKEIFVIQKCKQ